MKTKQPLPKKLEEALKLDEALRNQREKYKSTPITADAIASGNDDDKFALERRWLEKVLREGNLDGDYGDVGPKVLPPNRRSISRPESASSPKLPPNRRSFSRPESASSQRPKRRPASSRQLRRRKTSNGPMPPSSQEFKNNKLSSSSPTPLSTTKPDNTGRLLTSMSDRLQKVEARARQMSLELQEKDRKLLALQQRNTVLERSIAVNDRALLTDQIQDAESDNRRLRQEVLEMKAFLADYGLVWVGGTTADQKPANDKSSKQKPANQKSTKSKPAIETADQKQDEPSPPIIDVDLLLRKIKELNDLMGGSGPQLIHDVDNQRARFGEHQEKVNLVIFSDGILINRGPFRPYCDPTMQAFIEDIMDGYFPRDFKDTYPDGVYFEAEDRRKVSNSNFVAFSGSGKQLGLRIRNLSGMKEPVRQMSAEELLRRLPEKVVKNGRLIDIRADLKQRLQGKEPVSVETKSNERGTMIPACEASAERTSTLRVRQVGSSKPPLVITMGFDDTIGQLQTKISDLCKISASSFVIRTAFPNRAYLNPDETLSDAGLTPNATIILQSPQRSTA